MNKEAEGTVVSVSKQWWFKVNTKPIRTSATDGAIFPYIIKVRYTVDGKEYTKRKWINPGVAVPEIGSNVTVVYCEDKPQKAKII